MGAGGETLWSSLMLLTLSNTNILSKYQVVFPEVCYNVKEYHLIGFLLGVAFFEAVD